MYECCLVLGIAVAFHPWFKLDLVEYNYTEIYGDHGKKYVDRVRRAIVYLYITCGVELNPYFDYGYSGDVEESNFTCRNKNSDVVSQGMPCDILLVTTTTLASALSVGIRVTDESRVVLLPDIVEALVTTGDLLGTKKKRSVKLVERNEDSRTCL
ncbi:hypothetical protein ACH5RR_032783 [Cinchona calisaya]|uniref:hAT-like transposase RNase-H fold domain-containing protein n=1 Tax=Cinchona calisaya TaxID=153742 RepID=A0ABD2YL40_9GENT